jgi:hypothetical protein
MHKSVPARRMQVNTMRRAARQSPVDVGAAYDARYRLGLRRSSRAGATATQAKADSAASWRFESRCLRRESKRRAAGVVEHAAHIREVSKCSNQSCGWYCSH